MPDIDPKRLLFSISTSHPDHMLAYQQCDLALDPYPHGGGIVSLEQLYMGIPLITLYGKQPSGRSATSVLTAMGRKDWIAYSEQEYIDKAVALAGDIPTLNKSRKTLRDELMTSPVVKGYREAVEAAYRKVWKEYCGR
jgi:predicted O-linked N-acetylglucosamine transferase (SPINDLY family)